MPYLDKEVQAKYLREYMRKRRSDWIESQGGKCVVCGSTSEIEIDHIDPSQKSMNPTFVWSRRKDIREKELSKCQLLCVKCHMDKTKIEFSVVDYHGTSTGYTTRRCRCDECKRWKRDDSREYRRKNPFARRVNKGILVAKERQSERIKQTELVLLDSFH